MHFASSSWAAALLIATHALALLTYDETASIVEIGQTINLFGVLVDSSQYGQMDRVFTINTSVNFDLPGVGTLHGLPAVITEIATISNVTSQHSLTTYHTDLRSPTTADATAYIVGTFFGQGPQAGQIFTVYGTYVAIANIENLGNEH